MTCDIRKKYIYLIFNIEVYIFYPILNLSKLLTNVQQTLSLWNEMRDHKILVKCNFQ